MICTNATSYGTTARHKFLSNKINYRTRTEKYFFMKLLNSRQVHQEVLRERQRKVT